MVQSARVVLALIVASTISGSYSYGTSDSMYEQIAKALWQLQMKGDMNTALQHTEVWTGPTQGNSPGNLPKTRNRRGDGLVVRPIFLNDDPILLQKRVQAAKTGNIRPTQVLNAQPVQEQVASARRVADRQVIIQAPTLMPVKPATIGPERVYSNKMNRNTVKGYGSSLTKLIANKVKFNPPTVSDLPSNPIIDGLLGPQGNNVLPSNFSPLPSTSGVMVPNTPSLSKTTVQTKVKQRTVIAKPVKSTPVVVFPQSDIPSPSFSIVAPSLGQDPASFRFNNKEIKSNQLDDKNNRGQNSDFDKDLELNDVSQVLVDQVPPVNMNTENVKKQKFNGMKEQKKETSQIKPIMAAEGSRSDVPINNSPSKNQVVRQEAAVIEKVAMQRPVVEVIQSVLPDLVQTDGMQTKTKESSISSTTTTTTTTTPPRIVGISGGSSRGRRPGSRGIGRGTRPVGRGSSRGVRPIGIRGQAPVVSNSIPEVIQTTPAPTEVTAPNMTSTLWTTRTTTFTTPTTPQPVRVGVSMGSSRGRSGGFVGVRPSSRGGQPVGRGSVSVSRGSSRGIRPAVIQSQEPVNSVNIPETTQSTSAPVVALETTRTPAVGNEPQQPRQIPVMNSVGISRGSPRGRSGGFVGVRPSSSGAQPSGRGRSPASRGSPRGIRRQDTPVQSVSIPETRQSSFAPTTTTQPPAQTTPEQTRQVPAMDTAQFARRARPGRVVVNSLGNAKPPPSAVARGISRPRPPVVQPAMIPAASEVQSVDLPIMVQAQPAIEVQRVMSVPEQPVFDVPQILNFPQQSNVEVPLVLNSPEQAAAVEVPLVLNSEGAAEIDRNLANPSSAATEQPPKTTTPAAVTAVPRTLRPGMMSPEEKRLAQRRFHG